MAELFLNNIYLVLLLPLWVFLIIMLGRFFSVYVNKLVIYLLTLLSSVFGVFLCAGALWKLPTEKVLETRMNGWYLGNIIFGGLIGALIVDPATGAMWTFKENDIMMNKNERISKINH